MSTSLLDRAADVVLREYPALRAGRPVPLGNRGGFSGARLWRVETVAGPFCLRAWPPDAPAVQTLRTIHDWMQAAARAGLEFVPAVLPAADGATWVEHAGRPWEVTGWLPGRADFHDRPTPARLEAACVALARLHAVWAGQATAGPCPAVRRRLERYRHWCALVHAGWRPADADPWVARAGGAVRRHVSSVPELLAQWQARPVAVQPCLCDVWHDHVLFEEDAVTGLIDYGAAKPDHVAVDLARLLGSLAGDDAALWAVGLAAYRRLRPLSWEEEALVTVLDRTGTLLGAVNWLIWLGHEGRAFEDRGAVARRLTALVERIERWDAG